MSSAVGISGRPLQCEGAPRSFPNRRSKTICARLDGVFDGDHQSLRQRRPSRPLLPWQRLIGGSDAPSSKSSFRSGNGLPFPAFSSWSGGDILKVGAQAFACASLGAHAIGGFGSGGLGGRGASGGGSGGGGGGNGGWQPSGSSSAAGNVLADIAVAEGSAAEAFVEEVILLDVSGMKCGGCVGSVKNILEAQPGVQQASVNLATETARVVVRVPREAAGSQDRPLLSDIGEKLAQALKKGGFPSKQRDLSDRGSSVAAGLQAKRDAKAQRMQQVTRDLVLAWGLSALSGFAHLMHVWSGAPAWMHALHSPPLQAALSVAALLGPGRSILVDGFKGLWNNRPDMNTLVGLGASASFGVSCVAALLPGLGWKTFFEEPAMLLGFVLIGRTLEERAKLQASADMAALQDLVPTRARLALADGAHQEVPADTVAAGDVLRVLPGDRLPVDGVVLTGRSAVDESALTGEPLPITKRPGDTVTAGTMNCDGTLTVEAQHSGQQTIIADIVRMVEMAQARTAPVQRLADSVAGRFTYGVMAASAATFVFWAAVGTRMFPQVLASTVASPAATLLLSLQLACNVLVTACPCALGLATPTAVLVGTGAGARRGLLIRGGDILEAASQVDLVVFDKTGTLTLGKPRVTSITLLNASPGSSSSSPAVSEAELLQLAAAVERSTSHPVAKALVMAADAATAALSGTGMVPPVPLNLRDGTFQQEPGSGVSATTEDGRHVCVGSLAWVQDSIRHQSGSSASTSGSSASSSTGSRQGSTADRPSSSSAMDGVATAPGDHSQSASSGGGKGDSSSSTSSSHSRVYVAIDGAMAGCIEVADAVRRDALETVSELSGLGVRSVMLSGDNEAAALEVARAVGIAPADVYAGVKPAGKAALVEELQAAGHRVAMVGDGINDTGALAAASVGIAMGGGVDAASEVAKVVLMGDQLHQVADTLILSRKTMAKIHQNLCWAFGYNIIGVPLAAGALLPSLGICLTPSISAAMMGFSSVMVVSNSLLLQLEVRNMRSGLTPAAVPPPSTAAARALSSAA